jgi:DNA-binding transcriptional ArsR family regulator
MDQIMQATPDALFKSLADPTRRAIFERLARQGEQTVQALTDQRNYQGRELWLAALHRRPRASGREAHVIRRL